MLQDDCKVYTRKAEVDKTWTQLKIDFAIAHTDLVDSSQTAHPAGFQANNATNVQRYTAAAITNLANATQADKVSMVSLTSTVTTLTPSLTGANNKLVKALARITFLTKDLTTAKGSKPPYAPEVFAQIYYCSTHSP